MASNYVGQQTGTSKVQGILELKTDLKSLTWKNVKRDGKYPLQAEPFLTKDINEEGELLHDQWYRKYVQYTLMHPQRRTEDAIRLGKWLVSPRGVLWESEMAGLQTIQNDLNRKVLDDYKEIQATGKTATSTWSWKQLLNVVLDAGKAVVQNIGLTASTMAQVAASGTGYHSTTYLSRSYLKDGSGTVLGQLLAMAGVAGTGGYLDGASKAKQGKEVIGDQPWKHLPDDKKLVPGDDVHVGDDSVVYGMGGSYPQNWQGLNVTASKSLPAGQLHGVSRATQSNSFEVGQVNSTRRRKDHSDLGSKYGTVQEVIGTQKIERYSRRDPLAGFGITSASHPHQYIDRITNDPDRVASLYDDETYKYLKGSTPQRESSERVHLPSGPVKPGDVVRTVTEKLSKNNLLPNVPTVKKAGDAYIHKHFYGKANTYEGEFKWPGGNVHPDLEYDENEVINNALGLIPFCISTITPDIRTYLHFPAHLDSYDDSYTGNWDAVQYIGRAENFYGYTGFVRDINFSFKAVATNPQNLAGLYSKLNRLAGATAPSYKPGDRLFMRGTLASVTIGDLLHNQLGFIKSVRLSWKQDYLWDLGPEKDIADSTIAKIVDLMYQDASKHGQVAPRTVEGNYRYYRIPQLLDVSISFTPIEHNVVTEDYGAYFVFDPKEQETQTQVAIQETKTEKEIDPQPPIPLKEAEYDGGMRAPNEHTATRNRNNTVGGSGGYGNNGFPIPNGEVPIVGSIPEWRKKLSIESKN